MWARQIVSQVLHHRLKRHLQHSHSETSPLSSHSSALCRRRPRRRHELVTCTIALTAATATAAALPIVQVLETCKPIGDWLQEHGLPLTLFDHNSNSAKAVRGGRTLYFCMVCAHDRMLQVACDRAFGTSMWGRWQAVSGYHVTHPPNGVTE